MIACVLAAVSSLFVTPASLVEHVYSRKGWAFVPQTNISPRPIFVQKRIDGVILQNYVRRWNLRFRAERNSVEPLAISMAALFPYRVLATNGPKAVSPQTISGKGGSLVTIRQLFEAAGKPKERVHWFFWDRIVLARLHVSDLDKAMPDLALALGAKFDSKANSIDFDVNLFRKIGKKSLEERANRRDDDEPALMELILSAVDDKSLRAAYSEPRKAVVLNVVPQDAKNLPVVLSKYILAGKKAIIGNSGVDPMADIDPNIAPKIWFSPVNGPSIYLTTKAGKGVVF